MEKKMCLSVSLALHPFILSMPLVPLCCMSHSDGHSGKGTNDCNSFLGGCWLEGKISQQANATFGVQTHS